ncbi:MAG: YihY/virulence factor BrkB family protein [Verrucomicrobiota bacterium]
MNQPLLPGLEPPRWRGWLAFLIKIYKAVERDHLPIASAGVAFFLMLGIFPGLAALISIYSWLADPMEIERQLQTESGILPYEVHQILLNQMRLISGDGSTASWGTILGLVFALWAGSRAMKGLIQGLNIVFRQSEKREFISLHIASLVLTFALIAVVSSALFLIAIIPVYIAMLPGDKYTLEIFALLRWPFLLAIVICLLALLYRFGPSRNKPTWKWISPGAVSVTFIWLTASALFSHYVENFKFYLSTYSSLGAIAILMLWLYLTAFLVLLGAEIDEALRKE